MVNNNNNQQQQKTTQLSVFKLSLRGDAGRKTSGDDPLVEGLRVGDSLAAAKAKEDCAIDEEVNKLLKGAKGKARFGQRFHSVGRSNDDASDSALEEEDSLSVGDFNQVGGDDGSEEIEGRNENVEVIPMDDDGTGAAASELGETGNSEEDDDDDGNEEMPLVTDELTGDLVSPNLQNENADADDTGSGTDLDDADPGAKERENPVEGIDEGYDGAHSIESSTEALEKDQKEVAAMNDEEKESEEESSEENGDGEGDGALTKLAREDAAQQAIAQDNMMAKKKGTTTNIKPSAVRKKAVAGEKAGDADNALNAGVDDASGDTSRFKDIGNDNSRATSIPVGGDTSIFDELLSLIQLHSEVRRTETIQRKPDVRQKKYTGPHTSPCRLPGGSKYPARPEMWFDKTFMQDLCGIAMPSVKVNREAERKKANFLHERKLAEQKSGTASNPRRLNKMPPSEIEEDEGLPICAFRASTYLALDPDFPESLAGSVFYDVEAEMRRALRSLAMPEDEVDDLRDCSAADLKTLDTFIKSYGTEVVISSQHGGSIETYHVLSGSEPKGSKDDAEASAQIPEVALVSSAQRFAENARNNAHHFVKDNDSESDEDSDRVRKLTSKFYYGFGWQTCFWSGQTLTRTHILTQSARCVQAIRILTHICLFIFPLSAPSHSHTHTTHTNHTHTHDIPHTSGRDGVELLRDEASLDRNRKKMSPEARALEGQPLAEFAQDRVEARANAEAAGHREKPGKLFLPGDAMKEFQMSNMPVDDGLQENLRAVKGRDRDSKRFQEVHDPDVSMQSHHDKSESQKWSAARMLSSFLEERNDVSGLKTSNVGPSATISHAKSQRSARRRQRRRRRLMSSGSTEEKSKANEMKEDMIHSMRASSEIRPLQMPSDLLEGHHARSKVTGMSQRIFGPEQVSYCRCCYCWGGGGGSFPSWSPSCNTILLHISHLSTITSFDLPAKTRLRSALMPRAWPTYRTGLGPSWQSLRLRMDLSTCPSSRSSLRVASASTCRTTVFLKGSERRTLLEGFPR
jgi:hypothetical protein